jgi:hypothetical protein
VNWVGSLSLNLGVVIASGGLIVVVKNGSGYVSDSNTVMIVVRQLSGSNGSELEPRMTVFAVKGR